MKIPQIKHYVPPNKYDVPLLFAKMNCTGQHITSSEVPLFITASHPQRQDLPLKG